MGFEIGQHVQVNGGDYQGYYGEIVEINGATAKVKHNPQAAGFWINFDDLELVND